MRILAVRIDDRFYADSYGSGLLLRGVLLHFLRRFDEAQQAFDQIISKFVVPRSNYRSVFTRSQSLRRSKEFDEKSLLTPNALLEKAMVCIDLKQKQKANEYLQKAL